MCSDTNDLIIPRSIHASLRCDSLENILGVFKCSCGDSCKCRSTTNETYQTWLSFTKMTIYTPKSINSYPFQSNWSKGTHVHLTQVPFISNEFFVSCVRTEKAGTEILFLWVLLNNNFFSEDQLKPSKQLLYEGEN